jgi:hypothetical protein
VDVHYSGIVTADGARLYNTPASDLSLKLHHLQMRAKSRMFLKTLLAYSVIGFRAGNRQFPPFWREPLPVVFAASPP